jgi:prolyl oligopeptidase PreP (S9A serine peptidase family)
MVKINHAYGYGGFNIFNASFSIANAVWMEMGRLCT